MASSEDTESSSHDGADDLEVDSDNFAPDENDATAPVETVGAMEPPMLQRINRYRIQRLLGRGGFGSVYLAHDEQLERSVAIKIAHRNLVANAAQASLYLDEARFVAKLDHPNIVPVHDIGGTPEVPFYFVSKYIDGSNLATSMKQSPLDFHSAANLVATIADALQHAHKKGLVHRDVKPGNILVDRAGIPYLVDFGLALSEEGEVSSLRYVGTPSYTSPEQARGEGHRVDGRSDVFSLGVVLYELLTGRRPFRGANREVILQQVASYEPRPLRQYNELIPKQLERICRKAMAKLACERYESAHDLAEDLHYFVAHEDPTSSLSPIAHPAASQTDAFNVPATNSTTKHTQSASSSEKTPAASPKNLNSSDARDLAIIPKGIRAFDAHDFDFYLELVPGTRDRNGIPDSIRFWKVRLEEMNVERSFPVGLIYGPSGCGKSSFVQAGLLPRLSENVKTVFIESTAEETESRLLAGLELSCPTLPRGRSLVELIKLIRNGYGPGKGSKILIVLDQFEQWLHAHAADKAGDLIKALRQCDGVRVQALLLVRDDFWMATTRFMRELESRISEGHNAAAVDLFPIRHAINVLDAYGRAFGTLPDPPKQLSNDQNLFLNQAAEQLAENGKVICVRLALFAEIMKARPWTTESLKQVGGAKGVGHKFFQETFDGASTPISYKYHADAVRSALATLLPNVGQSIRGHSRTLKELNLASGYALGSEDFVELIKILDNEVRLITPCDIETEEIAINVDSVNTATAKRRYQLTHDYLVHSLRSWLTQKQRETRRGRMELLLAERASLWSAKPENRHLPSLAEDLGIRWLTHPERWTSEERAMMKRGKQVHGLRAALTGVLLMVVTLGGLEIRRSFLDSQRIAQEESLDRERLQQAEALVNGLAKADIKQVQASVDGLMPLWSQAEPLLLEKMDKATNDSEKLRLSIALLAKHSNQVDYLVERIPELSLDEFTVVRDALKVDDRSIPELSVDKLWSVALNPERSSTDRFQVGCALAAFAPQDARWEALTPALVKFLTHDDSTVPSIQFSARLEHLRPVAKILESTLRDLLGNGAISDFARQRAAISLASVLENDPERIVNALLICRKQVEFSPMLTVLAPHLPAARERLLATISLPSQENQSSERFSPQQHRTAIAAATLGRFGNMGPALQLLEESATRSALDHGMCSLLKHYVSEISLDHNAIVEELRKPSHNSEMIRELVEMLGRRGPNGLTTTELSSLTSQLRTISMEHPDLGVHEAALQALTKFGIDLPVEPSSESTVIETARQKNRELSDRLATTEASLKTSIDGLPARRLQWEKQLVERSADEFKLDDQSVIFKLNITGIGENEFELRTTLPDSEAVKQQIRLAKKVSALTDGCIELKVFPDSSEPMDLGAAVIAQANKPISYGCWYYCRSKPQFSGMLSRMESRGDRRGFDLWLDGLRVGAHFTHKEPDSYIKVVAAADHVSEYWNHVFVTYDGSSKAKGVKIYVDGRPVATTILADRLDGTIETSSPFMLGSRNKEFSFVGWIDDVYVCNRELSAREVESVFLSTIREVFLRPEKERSKEQKALLARAYVDADVERQQMEQGRLQETLSSDFWIDTKRWFVNRQGQSFAVIPRASKSVAEAVEYDFAICKHEVTIAQYKKFHADAWFDQNVATSDQCPAHHITWFEAASYCNWLSQQEGIPEDQWCFTPALNGEYGLGMILKPNYSKLSGYRMPTRSEWRFACRQQATTSFFFGNSGELIGEYAWYAGNALGITQPVGKLTPNSLGIFDMHGNVWEWTVDLDNLGPDGKIDSRAQSHLQGGAMNSSVSNVTISSSTNESPAVQSPYYGFRLAKSIPSAW